ncbi:MAG: hypothetical protein AVDCRST_MAG02-2085, partial [uncultured Rubrobacteraceae bacterium]
GAHNLRRPRVSAGGPGRHRVRARKGPRGSEDGRQVRLPRGRVFL